MRQRKIGLKPGGFEEFGEGSVVIAIVGQQSTVEVVRIREFRIDSKRGLDLRASFRETTQPGQRHRVIRSHFGVVWLQFDRARKPVFGFGQFSQRRKQMRQIALSARGIGRDPERRPKCVFRARAIAQTRVNRPHQVLRIGKFGVGGNGFFERLERVLGQAFVRVRNAKLIPEQSVVRRDRQPMFQRSDGACALFCLRERRGQIEQREG